MGPSQRCVITGGAGFVGSALVRHLVHAGHAVLNVDCLTYAGDLQTVCDVAQHSNYHFLRASICDASAIGAALTEFRPNIIFHCAAETHVDRSIDDPTPFLDTNVVGTFTLLSTVLKYWESAMGRDVDALRFVHVSTDEVFGSLPDHAEFKPGSPYRPSSPYSASKAASDHFALAWHASYGLPCVIVNCSNNFGPYQHPEKLIPTVIYCAIRELPIPIYGAGLQIRDWIYVGDHVDALELIAARGRVGEQYLVSARNALRNIDLVGEVCAILDELRSRTGGGRYADLLQFVDDRPGHDDRYAIDPAKIEQALGWAPRFPFRATLVSTVQWYLEHPDWLEKRANLPGRQGLRRGERVGRIHASTE